MFLKNIIKKVDYIFITVFFLCIYLLLIFFYRTDIIPHIEFALDVKHGIKGYSPNFLYYFLLNTFSFCSDNFKIYIVLSVFLLTSATLLKYHISKKYIFTELKKMNTNICAGHLITLTLLLFFCFSIPDIYVLLVNGKFYLGRAVPFVIHNSTTIFLFPIAILLFIKQAEIFRTLKIKNKDLLVIFILIVLNAVVKPSFLFAYLPFASLYIIYIFIKRKIKI